MPRKESELYNATKTIVVTDSDIELSTPDGFERRFFKHLENSRTNEEAFEKTAADFRAIYKYDKYTSYNSFRVVKNRKYKVK